MSSFINPGKDHAQAIWRVLEKELPLINNITHPITFYGVNTYLDEADQNSIHYMAAVKVDTLDEIPPTLTAKRIPAGTYIECSFSGSHQTARDYLYQTCISKLGRYPAYPLDMELIEDACQRIKSEGVVRKILIPISESIMS